MLAKQHITLTIIALAATIVSASETQQVPIFIGTDELEMMLMVRSNSDLKIFDCTVNSSPDSLISFHQSHVPRSEFIDLRYFRNMSSKYPFMLPGVDQFIDFMKLYGIKKSTRVVLYDTMSGYYATRVHWMLRTYGHTQVSVLDGGF